MIILFRYTITPLFRVKMTNFFVPSLTDPFRRIEFTTFEDPPFGLGIISDDDVVRT